jgi:hypothetical protein
MAAVALLLARASAHIVMNTPFGFPNLKVANSPLGQPVLFPCQFGTSATYDFSNSTKVVAGDSTILSFTGSAVHGGGSCQVSISKTPSADPKDWKVIKSIIGGCPATITQSDGNLDQIGTFNGYPQGKQCTMPDSDETDCVKQYTIQIPQNIPPGQYYFSWSWFNKVGHREMYQNCAPIEISSEASSDEYLNILPSLFYANVDGQPCVTAALETNVLGFPNPGLSVFQSTNANDTSDPAVLGSCMAKYGSINAANTSSSAGADLEAPSNSASLDCASDTSVIPTTSIAAQKSAQIILATPLIPAILKTPTYNTPAACPNPCSKDGALICFTSSTFGLCDHGCAIPRPVAAGTYCNNSGIFKRDPNSAMYRHGVTR